MSIRFIQALGGQKEKKKEKRNPSVPQPQVQKKKSKVYSCWNRLKLNKLQHQANNENPIDLQRPVRAINDFSLRGRES